MTHLDEALIELRGNLMEMARLVTSQFHKSLSSLFEQNADYANEVIFTEKRVNAFELNIDKECERIFALLSPVAHDMRFVFATLKINADLERIADYAEGVAKLTLMGLGEFDEELIKELRIDAMYEVAYQMMKDITVAFYEDDTNLARTVYTNDVKLNDINHDATDITVAYCQKHTDKIEQALYLLSMVRKIERIGDHITNIAEDIIFYKEAVVIKHASKEYVYKKKP